MRIVAVRASLLPGENVDTIDIFRSLRSYRHGVQSRLRCVLCVMLQLRSCAADTARLRLFHDKLFDLVL